MKKLHIIFIFSVYNSSLWNQLVKLQSIFNLTDFHYSKPSNKIYIAYFMYPAFLFSPSTCIYIGFSNTEVVNPLPHMPILGFSNSAANKDMMSKYGQMGIQLSG